MSKLDYKNSGVDIEAGDAFADWIGDEVKKSNPYSDKIVSGVGGFASIFKMNFPEIKNPCLVTCTDGVGTKVKIAAQFDSYSGVGQDLVAMCVNDLICTGGKPLLFLDYYATGKLDLKNAKSFLSSVKKACDDSGCALVGGETAEMPGVYQGKDFDCAGFAVGIVDEQKTIGPHRVQAGDILIGLSSSGFHSNGYSLLRKVFADDLEQWKDILLAPTALYVQFMSDLLAVCEVHAAAHITGGGIENIPRVIPEHLEWQKKLWPLPELFLEVQKRTQMSDEEMYLTLNCGVGFVIIAEASSAELIHSTAHKHHFKTYDLGAVQKKIDKKDKRSETKK